MSKKNQILKKDHKEKSKPKDELITFAFTKQNYRLLIIAIVVITLGFLLMIGGGSDDPNVFSDRIFSFRRMTLAPILILAGYIIEIFAIMKRPKG
jgi:fumarate reductase subunit D